MIQIVPQLRILVACQPVDFRKGIDALAAVCRHHLAEDPFSGAIFLFRNRSGTSLKLLVYDGIGFWLCIRRFSQGRLRWWPSADTNPVSQLAAQQLSVLLYNGLPTAADFVPAWRQLPEALLTKPRPSPPPQATNPQPGTSTVPKPEGPGVPRPRAGLQPSDTRSG